MFNCVTCENDMRDGFAAKVVPIENGKIGHMCIYCYNEISKTPMNTKIFLERADRMDHEKEIKEIVDVYIEDELGTVLHTYSTDFLLRLVVRFERCIKEPSEAELIKFRAKLIRDGMKCGELQFFSKWQFTVDFQDNKRQFHN